MTSLGDTLDADEYDEFELLRENAAEWDIPFTAQPVVSRRSFTLPSGQTLSYLRWGEGEPELVFLHGGAQNGHTWDTVMLALGRPAVAVDLPGHGHSDRRDDRDYGPWAGTTEAEVVSEFGSLDDAPGVESRHALLARAREALDAVLPLLTEGPVVLVAHDAVNRALLADLAPALLTRGPIEQHTACWNMMVREPGRWRVTRVNEVPQGPSSVGRGE